MNENLTGVFPVSPIQGRSKQKKEALQQSGRELFLKNGFQQTTAKEIAAYAGVATGTFYRYFTDKRQLLMSLIEEQLDILMPLELEWKSGDPEKLLASRLEYHYQNVHEMNLQKLVPELLIRDSELAGVLNTAKLRARKKFSAHLVYLQDKGLIWPNTDNETLLWCLESLLERLHEQISQGKRVNFSQFSKLFCRLLFPPEIIEKMRDGKII